ncbi:hypothetical protein ABK040_008366 [Willaertia magna]
MNQLTKDIILHLFDFLIIPPKDFISVFLLNKPWKENTLDNLIFWEKQLSNLFFIYYKNKPEIEQKDIFLFYKMFFLNPNNLQLCRTNFVNNDTILFFKLYKTLSQKRNCNDIKKIFIEIYDNFYFNDQYDILNYNYIETVSFNRFNNLLNNTYSYNDDKELNYGLNKVFNKLILKKDLELFKDLNDSFYYVTYKNRYKKSKLVTIICNYLQNDKKYCFLFNHIKDALEQLFATKNRNQIFNYLFIKVFENLQLEKNFTIYLIHFLSYFVTIFKKYNAKIPTILNRDRLAAYVISLCSVMGDLQYTFMDFLLNHFNFDSLFYTSLIYNSINKNNSEFILIIYKLLSENSNCLIKVKDLLQKDRNIFESLQDNDIKLFKEKLYYLHKTVYKEYNKESVFLKLNFLKEIFVNSKMEKEFNVFKKKIFKQFIENIFNYTACFTIKCVDYFVKEWHLNFNKLFFKGNVTKDYLLQTLNVNYQNNSYEFQNYTLPTVFPIIIYDIQLTLLKSKNYSLEQFNVIINYLKENQLFNFSVKMFIAEECYLNKVFKRKENKVIGNNSTFIWKEITTTDLIERIKSNWK